MQSNLVYCIVWSSCTRILNLLVAPSEPSICDLGPAHFHMRSIYVWLIILICMSSMNPPTVVTLHLCCVHCCTQESADGTDTVKSESVRKVLRIAVRRASSLPGDVVDGLGACGATGVIEQPVCVDASTAADSGAAFTHFVTFACHFLV